MEDYNTLYETVFVARQPVFDADLKMWAYELLYRDSQMATSAVFSDELEATVKVMANIALCPDSGFDHANILINFSQRAVVGEMPLAFPAQQTIVCIPETVDTASYFMTALKNLKDEGYKIAINGYEGLEGSFAVCDMADILMVDVLNRTEEDLVHITAEARQFGAQLMAKKVEDHQTLHMARELGFTYFQGFFFKEPQIISSRKTSSTEVARLKLFDIIERDEPDFAGLARTIEADVSISYRLLTFLNSAAFGFSKKITSIKQAVVLAGWKPIRNWLRLVLLTDMTPSGKTMELSFLSAHRARFMELASADSDHSELADPLFLLGLFSLLEPILDLPMAEILEHLPLDEMVGNTLTGKKTALTGWMELTQAIESSDWTAIDELLASLNLDPEKISDCYQNSLAWCNRFFGETSAG